MSILDLEHDQSYEHWWIHVQTEECGSLSVCVRVRWEIPQLVRILIRMA